MKNVSVSVLSCDFLNLGSEIARINSSDSVSSIHLDIMDGIFVPNISFGFDIAQKIVRGTHLPCHAHLMIYDPLKYLPRISNCGVKKVYVHIREDISYIKNMIDVAGTLGIELGITLSPGDEPDSAAFKEIAPFFKNVLIMTVEPGFGGQKFDESQLRKADFIKATYPEKKITIDGGVKFSMLDSIKNVDEFVIGSDFFKN